MNITSRSLIMAIFYCTLSFFSVQAMEKDAEQWLILGAGGETDIPEWNKYFAEIKEKEGRTIEWVGLNYKCPNSPKCIQTDFNNLEQLNKALEAYENYFDVISFDLATVDYINWTTEHLELFKEKLKEGGKFYVLISKRRAPEKSKTISKEFTNVGQFLDFMKRQYTDQGIWRSNIFINGMPYGKISYKFVNLPRLTLKEYEAAFEKLVIDHNVSDILKPIFGPNIKAYHDKRYPVFTKSREKYYLIVNSATPIEMPKVIGEIEKEPFPYKPVGIFNLKSGGIQYISIIDKDDKLYVLNNIGNPTLREFQDMIQKFVGKKGIRIWTPIFKYWLDEEEDQDLTLNELQLGNEDVFSINKKIKLKPGAPSLVQQYPEVYKNLKRLSARRLRKKR